MHAQIPRRGPFLLTVVLLACTLLGAGPAQAQAVLTGRVTDARTGEPLASAQVEVVAGATTADPSAVERRTLSDVQGRFRIVDLAPGTYVVRVRRIGYQERELAGVSLSAGAPADLAIALGESASRLGEIVTTGDRIERTILETPAAVYVVDRATIQQRPATTLASHLREMPGVDVMPTGINGANVTTRGFNNIFSGALLVLTDKRIASVPSLRVNAFYLIPSVPEDVEKMEVVLGPASALYGPNSANGILHVISQSPFTSAGTTVSVGAGYRDVLQGALRHAGSVGGRFGWKISGQYMQGTEWPHDDPLDIEARDFDVERWSGEGRLDFRPTPESEIIFGAGRTTAGSAIEMTGQGAAQVNDWRYDYYQLRGSAGRFFAQAFLNQSDAGTTRLLRTGMPIVDESRMYVAQVQHGFDLGSQALLNYGIDLQRTDPRTKGTITGRNEDRDRIDEIGGYVQGDYHFTPRIDLIGALRVDDHSHLEDPVWSPRAAVVYKPGDAHAFRVTFNRAFSTPTSNNLFLDLLARANLSGLPFPVRTVGVPEQGLHFRRDCAGGVGTLCMRTPFGTSTAYMPAVAAPLWPAMAQVLYAQSQGQIDIRSVPSPTPAQVGTVLRVLDVETESFRPIDPAQIRDIEQLRPTVNNVIEVGYKGEPTSRVRLSVDVYFERKNDFIGPLLVETPNAFLDSTGVANYLIGVGYPAANARVIAGFATRVPLGTITPDHELTSSPELILTYRNLGTVELWGSDLGGAIDVTDRITVDAAYSWTSDDFFSREEVGGLSDVALNAPKQKGSLGVRFRDDAMGLTLGARGRYAAEFPMNSGVYIGTVERATLVDVSFGYAIPRTSARFALDVANVLDKRHRPAVGAPEMGRMAMTKLQYTF